MEELDEYRQKLLSSLENVVEELSRLSIGLPPQAWYLPGEVEGQTPHYVLSRLLQLEAQVFNPQMRRIVYEDTPLLPPFDLEAWMADHYEPEKPVTLILEQFTSLRGQGVAWLRQLPVDNWSRTARHPWWGVHTLQWWAELQLEYSRQHIKQLTSFPSM